MVLAHSQTHLHLSSVYCVQRYTVKFIFPINLFCVRSDLFSIFVIFHSFGLRLLLLYGFILQGSYQPFSAMTACHACAAGYYSNILAQIECVPCPANSVTSAEAQTSCSPCQANSAAPAGSSLCVCNSGTSFNILHIDQHRTQYV